jgi:hypothetical protein
VALPCPPQNPLSLSKRRNHQTIGSTDESKTGHPGENDFAVPGGIKREATLRFHLTPVRMAISKENNNKCWQRCSEGETGNLIHCGGNTN